MTVKFLVKNITSRNGSYRSGDKDFILKPGQQVFLDYPPAMASVEIKVIQMNQ